jgi:hypothetical protein
MFGGVWTLLGILAALVIAAPAAAQPSTIHRIVAIGDLHGDFEAWRAIARAAGLIDARGRWIGGETVLVQIGDVPDRGPDSLRIIDDLMRLQREAPRKRGRVVALVGNHEAMNMTGDLRYVSAGEYAAFAGRKSRRLRDDVFTRNREQIEAAYRRGDPAMTAEAIRDAWLSKTPLGLLEHQAAWSPKGRIGSWVVRNPAVVLIDGALFVHGGLCAGYAGLPLAEINRQVAAALTAGATASDAIINDEAGPLWCRRLAASSNTALAEQLDLLLTAYGARRIVIGHTPVLSGIAVLEGGRLARIDTGISSAYGGKLTYLEILQGDLVPHVVERPAPGQRVRK